MSEGPKPFLTVAIPVYNGESVLAPMLASLDAQDWGLLEVRFGDDGSTDGTPDVLADFAARHPGRAFVERHDNMGPGPTRNRLLAQAAGDYIWFCDADDELAPGCIARIAQILQATPADMLALCYCSKPDSAEKALLGVEPVPVTRERLLLSIPGATVAKVSRTAFLRANGIAFTDCRAGEDFVFTMEAACRCESALFWYARPYWIVRRDNSLSGTVDGRFCEGILDALRRMDAVAARFPQYRMEIGVQRFDLASYFLRRIRDDASPDMCEKWLPTARDALNGLVEAWENPLIRIPRSYQRKENESAWAARAALRREQAALRREQAALRREQAAHRREQAIRNSLSWRVTAPLRSFMDFLARKRHRKDGGTPVPLPHLSTEENT